MKHLCTVVLGVATACGGADKSADEPKAGDDRIELGSERPDSRRSAVPDIDDDDDPSLEVEGLKGRLSQYDIESAIQSNQRALLGCFSQESKKRRWLGGDVKLAFVVARDGTVKNARVMESDLGSWTVEACLLGVARGMTFSQPKGGGDATFDQPIEFPGRKQVLLWAEDRTDSEVADKLASLAECENAPDDVWITMYVGNRGRIMSTGFATPSEAGLDDEWANCAANVIGQWTLSDPRGKVAKAYFRYAP